jgi:hypothetical protein
MVFQDLGECFSPLNLSRGPAGRGSFRAKGNGQAFFMKFVLNLSLLDALIFKENRPRISYFSQLLF